jgi:hypothetical protein
VEKLFSSSVACTGISMLKVFADLKGNFMSEKMYILLDFSCFSIFVSEEFFFFSSPKRIKTKKKHSKITSSFSQDVGMRSRMYGDSFSGGLNEEK